MVSLTLKIDRLSIPAFIEASRRIVDMMTGNASFLTPTPALADITKALNTLETTYQSGPSGDHTAKALQKSQRKDANAMIMQLNLILKSPVETMKQLPAHRE